LLVAARVAFFAAGFSGRYAGRIGGSAERAPELAAGPLGSVAALPEARPPVFFALGGRDDGIGPCDEELGFDPAPDLFCGGDKSFFGAHSKTSGEESFVGFPSGSYSKTLRGEAQQRDDGARSTASSSLLISVHSSIEMSDSAISESAAHTTRTGARDWRRGRGRLALLRFSSQKCNIILSLLCVDDNGIGVALAIDDDAIVAHAKGPEATEATTEADGPEATTAQPTRPARQHSS